MSAVYERELKSYYTSFTGYAFAAFLLIFAGIYTMGICISSGYTEFEYVIGNTAFIFLLGVPIVTMKMFTEEKKQRIDKLLYSLPISMTKIVMGKFFAVVTVFVLPLLIVMIYPIILSFYGNISFKVVLISFIAFILLGAALISIGMFISSLTESQPLAAGVTFVVLLINYFLSSLASIISTGSELMKALSVYDKIDNAIEGVLSLQDMSFLILVTGVFLFLTVQSLEKRRWS